MWWKRREEREEQRAGLDARFEIHTDIIMYKQCAMHRLPIFAAMSAALLNLLLLSASSHLITAQESKEYTRYTSYHPYCSTPSQMQNRAIPPLQPTNSTVQLVHVTALIRHGARTPYASAPIYQCWNDYWTDPSTGIWDCDLKTYTAPPSTDKKRMKLSLAEGELLEEEPDFLFEKNYDALRFLGKNRTGNELNGTCQLGQLLMKGYEQELANGLHLRQAYLYDGNETTISRGASNPSMRLWDMTATMEDINKVTTNVGDASKKIYQEPNLRYRADDEQRTLMSGQILLRGLFGPEILAADVDDETTVIKLHTGDYRKDVLVINKNICPRAAELEAEAYESEEFKQWNETSVEVQIIRKFAQSKLGLDEVPFGMLDCLMTTMCTDRPLPDPIDDYDGSLGPTPWKEDGSEGIAIVSEKDFTNIFERFVNYAVKQETFAYKYNDAALSKLGMGPLWKEIMANILPIIGANSNYTFAEETPPKLALFSGHDTTLMPILATLGEDVWSGLEWAPYASMLLIEVYETPATKDEQSEFPSGYAFRLVYNGAVLTSRMDGCSSELCDSQVLADQVMPFAIFEERDCAPTNQDEAEVFDDTGEEATIPEPKKKTAESVVNPRQKWGIFGVAVLSAAFGSMATCFMMRQHYQNAYRHASTLERELSMAENTNDTDYGSNSSARNGTRQSAIASSDYIEESDEDRII